MTRTLRMAACMAACVAAASACEMTYDTQTGERTTQWTLPGTAANEAAFNEQWRRCTQFASDSVCARQFGGRTPMESAFSFGSGRDADP